MFGFSREKTERRVPVGGRVGMKTTTPTYESKTHASAAPPVSYPASPQPPQVSQGYSQGHPQGHTQGPLQTQHRPQGHPELVIPPSPMYAPNNASGMYVPMQRQQQPLQQQQQQQQHNLTAVQQQQQ